MNWFERHLNWSLFLGLVYVPVNVSFTVSLIAFIIIFIMAFIQVGGGFNALALLSTIIGMAVIAQRIEPILVVIDIIIIVVLTVILTFWFLGRKGKSRAFTFLFIFFWIIGVVGLLNSKNPISGYFFLAAVIGNILTLIILLLLGNESTNFEAELLGARLDAEPYGGYDERQLKELDYTPDKNIMNMAGSRGTENVGATGDVAGYGGVSAGGDIGVTNIEAQAQEKEGKKVVERPASQEIIKPPILLNDAGAAIHCYYHPGADAVNLCSRCRQYVCIECNYITGTHPICHNCWNTRGESPIAPPPVKKPVSPAPGKPEKQKIAKPEKSAKLEAEKNEWRTEFVALCEQASPIINIVIRKSADGMPASPLDLMEGLKLRPMLERTKKMSKPKDKELHEAKDEFEQILSGCIKIADTAANFVGGGGQALQGGPDFKHIVDSIDTANGLMERLSQKLATFSQPQE
jgi:hypothetical protein